MRPAPVALALCLSLLAPAVARAQGATPAATFPAPVPATGSPFDGLNLLLTRQRLLDLQQAVIRGDPLVQQACADAIASANQYVSQTPDPIVGVFQVPGYYTSQQAVQQQLAGQIRGDARAAIALAWGYALTGQQSFADASKRFIWAWVDNLTTPVDGLGATGFAGIQDWLLGESGGDTALVAHYSFPAFLYAADILNGFGQLSATEKSELRAWLTPFIDYHLTEESFANNHLDWQVLFLATAAHATEDPALFDTAIAYFRDGQHHQAIAADGALWRELARNDKAATYTLMALEAKVQLVAIAANHGFPGLEDLVADPRVSGSVDDLELDYVTGFGSSGVASAGGSLHDAVSSLRDFVNDPTSWNRWQPVIQTSTIAGPASPSDWGWLFEAANAWWPDPSYVALTQAAPYGLQPERAYTLSFATLVFHPLASSGTTPTPSPSPTPAPGPSPSGSTVTVSSPGGTVASGSTAAGTPVGSSAGGNGGGGGGGGCVVDGPRGNAAGLLPLLASLAAIVGARRRSRRVLPL